MKLTKSKLREIIRDTIKEISTLGTSGLKSFAKKHKYSVKSKKSGGRVPLMYLKKDGKEFGPFDPTVLTKKYLLKKLGLTEDAPAGWEGTVKSMKKHKDIDNPWALSHWMKNKGYISHKESVNEAYSSSNEEISTSKDIKTYKGKKVPKGKYEVINARGKFATLMRIYDKVDGGTIYNMVPIGDIIRVAKSFKESVNEAVGKAELKKMIYMAKKAGAKKYDIIKSLASDLSKSEDEIVKSLEKYNLIGMTESVNEAYKQGDKFKLGKDLDYGDEKIHAGDYELVRPKGPHQYQLKDTHSGQQHMLYKKDFEKYTKKKQFTQI